jgi:hypothetical protein
MGGRLNALQALTLLAAVMASWMLLSADDSTIARSVRVVGAATGSMEPAAVAIRKPPRVLQAAPPPSPSVAAPATMQSAISDECADWNVTRVKAMGKRYLFMEPMRAGYGLTNQLLAYAGLVFYAIDDNRVVVFPYARTGFNSLVSLRKSQFRPFFSASTNRCENWFAELLPGVRLKDQKFYKLRHSLSRIAIAANPDRARRKYKWFMSMTPSSRSVRLWDMYGRWPFSAPDAPAWQTFGWFMCGIHFSDPAETQAAATYAGIAGRLSSAAAAAVPPNRTGRTAAPAKNNKDDDRANYVAVHLRMEPQDMVPMGRAKSSADQVSAFMHAHVFPLARRLGATGVLICSGPLPIAITGAIRHAAGEAKLVALWKDDFNATLPSEPAESFQWHGTPIVPTNSFGAIIDLLLMERAVAVVATAYSSFTATVYSRRCCVKLTELGAATHRADESAFEPFGGGPRNGNVYLYDVYQDGTLTAPVEYPCGYQLGDYLVGPTIPAPPPQLQVFNANFNGSSPLYAAEPQRNAAAVGTVPSKS